jgi:aryl-alcohol dehydrogenase-like predicted oxidoreductase
MSISMPGPATLGQMVSPPAYYNKPAFEQHGMQYVRLGQTGAVISRITLGLMSYSWLKEGKKPWFPWILGQEAAEPFVQQALEAGITSFDTAEVYDDGGSEEFFGHALKKLLPLSRFTRHDLFVASKINPPRTLSSSGFGGLQKGLSRKAIFDAVDGSLRRLQLEYLDLYLVHRFDYNTAIEETMRALHDLVVSGKIRYIGASAMHAWQFAKMQRVAEINGWTKFSVMQNHYNAIYRGQPPLTHRAPSAKSHR